MRPVLRLVGSVDTPGGVVKVRIFRGVVKAVRRYRNKKWWTETVYATPDAVAIVHVAYGDRKWALILVKGGVITWRPL